MTYIAHGLLMSSSSGPRSYAENGTERSSEARSDVHSARAAHVKLIGATIVRRKWDGALIGGTK
jgi:hypothetical protein